MKEIIAVIQMNMVNKTKQALLEAGFPSITCKKVMGRGRKKVEYELFHNIGLETQDIVVNKAIAEHLSEGHRLMPKRMIIVIVDDKDVTKVVTTLIRINKNGNPGNGKIFVSNVDDVVRVRTGETGVEAI